VKCLIKLNRRHNWKLRYSLQGRGKQTRVGVDEHCSGIPEFAAFLTAITRKKKNKKDYGTPPDDVL
jgi:hypothetical protein